MQCINTASATRNPSKAKDQFEKSCAHGHAPSCFNLAVLYKKGDEGVAADPVKFEEYKAKTQELVKVVGLASGRKIG